MIRLLITFLTIFNIAFAWSQETTKIPFELWIKSNNKPVKKINVKLAYPIDTVTLMTDKNGFAISSLSKGKPYPTIIIDEPKFEYFEFKITNAYLDTKAVLYNTFELKKREYYEYEVCIKKSSKPGHIISNKRGAIEDTIIANVKGQVVDSEEPLPFANIIFTNKTTKQVSGTTADFAGNFKISIPSGQYKVDFQLVGYDNFFIDNLSLGAGQVQEIKVSLGSASGFVTYGIKSKKKLSDKQLKDNIRRLTEETNKND